MTPTVFTRADRDLAESLFTSVASETRQADGDGVCRPSYGHGESVASRIVASVAMDLGLTAQGDAAGNLMITRDGFPTPGSTWVGSHLDAVPRGGNYDGLAGVVAAVLLIAKARETRTDVPLVGVGLRGEESARFGVPSLGSKALLGRLKPADLDRRRRSQLDDPPWLLKDPTLRSCMGVIGAQPGRVIEGPIVAPDQIGSFWELHIEQGPILAARGKPVGVVSGIRGSARAANARILGRAGHSGTTPHDLRDDAVVRFAEIMTKLEARRRMLAELGDDLVFTCGIVGTNPQRHAITTIADEVGLSLDVRGLDVRLARDFLSYAESLGVDLGEVVETPGAMIARATWRRAAVACEDLGVGYDVLPSGAGHDAAVFQQAGVAAGMIFVRNRNGSHNPDEAMDIDDFMLGCEVLWRTITDRK